MMKMILKNMQSIQEIYLGALCCVHSYTLLSLLDHLTSYPAPTPFLPPLITSLTPFSPPLLLQSHYHFFLTTTHPLPYSYSSLTTSTPFSPPPPLLSPLLLTSHHLSNSFLTTSPIRSSPPLSSFLTTTPTPTPSSPPTAETLTAHSK